MSSEATFWLFQLAAAACLALWMIVAVANNVQGFRASVGAVGLTMSMTPLREAPFDTLPFHGRAVNNVAAHRAAVIGILGIQIASALALSAGAALIAAEPFRHASEQAVSLLNIGLSAFVLCWCLMFSAGLWFGFWIKQEGLLLTQLLLAGWGLLSFLVFNMPR